MSACTFITSVSSHLHACNQTFIYHTQRSTLVHTWHKIHSCKLFSKLKKKPVLFSFIPHIIHPYVLFYFYYFLCYVMRYICIALLWKSGASWHRPTCLKEIRRINTYLLMYTYKAIKSILYLYFAQLIKCRWLTQLFLVPLRQIRMYMCAQLT